MMKISADQLN